MKTLVIAALALGGALVISGCGDGDGGGGPAAPPSNPFGSESSGASSEPSGAFDEGAGGPREIASLCVTDCGRISSSCPPAAGTNCVASCQLEFLSNPDCASQAKAFLACVSTAEFVCSRYGTLELDSSECAIFQLALSDCINTAGPPGS
jgi:hypothetical protein